jgi:nitrogen fixation/metabolism regulation signal transduction histidine kinase
MSKIVERVYNLTFNRFIYHKILFSSPLLTNESEDFQILGQSNLLVSAINNIIYNSIYWTKIKHEREGDTYLPHIFITTNTEEFEGYALIIGDNGDGFRMEAEDLIRPFVTTRPGGMGLGLYYTSLVMNMFGGKLLFIDPKDYEIPDNVSGAVVALVFPKK